MYATRFASICSLEKGKTNGNRFVFAWMSFFPIVMIDGLFNFVLTYGGSTNPVNVSPTIVYIHYDYERNENSRIAWHIIHIHGALLFKSKKPFTEAKNIFL